MMVSKNKRAATAKTSRHVNLSIGFGDDCRPQSSHFNLLCEPCFPFFLSYYSTRWCYLKSIPQIRNKLDTNEGFSIFSYFLFFSFNFFFGGEGREVWRVAKRTTEFFWESRVVEFEPRRATGHFLSRTTLESEVMVELSPDGHYIALKRRRKKIEPARYTGTVYHLRNSQNRLLLYLSVHFF